jgi:hypothetical protein
MKLLLMVCGLSLFALFAGPAIAENAIDVSLWASVANQDPYDIFDIYYCAINTGMEPVHADFTVTLWKGNEVLGTTQFEANLAVETPYTQRLELPISDSVPADVYGLTVSVVINTAADEANAMLTLDAGNNVIEFIEDDIIVANENATWGTIKELFR